MEITAEYCHRSAFLPEPLPGLKRVPATQYLRPNGRPKEVWSDRPIEVADLALELISAGYRFEIEILNTGHIHGDVVPVFDPDDEGPLANFVVPNGSGVGAAFDAMVRRAHARLKT